LLKQLNENQINLKLLERRLSFLIMSDDCFCIFASFLLIYILVSH